MATNFSAADPLGADFRAAIQDALTHFVDTKATNLHDISPTLEPMTELARTFLGGGKRLRPAFCYWSAVAAGGAPEHPRPLLRAAASLDVLHVSALMHDDVMDGSNTRRGVPSAHRQFEALHAEREGRGPRDAFGRSGAILLGDLLLVWSAELFDRSGLPTESLAAALPLVHAVRTEVTAGQFLDVMAQTTAKAAEPSRALEMAHHVVEFKSARYTVVRPCQIGAALGGASPELLTALQDFGSPLGRAFQFRDDLLGVFGDEAVTGKPAGDDLREGKRTMLVAHALAQAPEREAAELDAMLGDPHLSTEQVDRARQIIVASGAQELVEQTIADGHREALEALERASMTDEGREALVSLADAAVNREA